MMKHIGVLCAVAAATILNLPSSAYALTAADLVGTWVLKADAGGPFGDHPRGMLMFDATGRFIQIVTRSDMAKSASSKPSEARPDEFKAIALGSIAFFGTYSVTGTTLNRHVEASSYPNQVGTDQSLGDLTLKGDELAWTNPASPVTGGKVALIWTKVK
jgi:Lipocalin-like domain